jgi:hypothetical protein
MCSTARYCMPGHVFDKSGKAAALGLIPRMKDELRSLSERELELTNRICLLCSTIDGLARLANLPDQVGEAPTMPMPRGCERLLDLTDDCASLLRSSPYPLTIGDVCSLLHRNRRIKEKQTEDPLFAVWQSLKRLAEHGFVQVSESDGIRKWVWAKPEGLQLDFRASAAELLAHEEPTRIPESPALQPHT